MFFLFHRRRRAPHSAQKPTYELRARQFRRDHRLFLSRNVKWVDEMLRTKPAYTRESCQKRFENLFARLPNGKSMSTIRSLKLIDFSHRAFHPAEWTVRSTCVWAFHFTWNVDCSQHSFHYQPFNDESMSRKLIDSRQLTDDFQCESVTSLDDSVECLTLCMCSVHIRHMND